MTQNEDKAIEFYNERMLEIRELIEELLNEDDDIIVKHYSYIIDLLTEFSRCYNSRDSIITFAKLRDGDYEAH